MSDVDLPAPDARPKIDPEALVLRSRPARVVRFRRGAIIAIAAAGSTAMIGVTWVALKPAAIRLVAQDGDRAEPVDRAPDDALAGAPKSYGEVPRLGPPLPGDLGRPILRHQQAVGAGQASPGTERAAEAAEAERHRMAAEAKAARESAVLVQLAAIQPSSGAAGPSPPAAAAPETASQPSRVVPDRDRDPGNQQRKADFLGSRDREGDINPHMLAAPVSPYTLSAGTVIAASLITGVNSDLPGLIIAQVTENAFDTATGRILMIPQGSRLIGTYDSVVAFGQRRALLVWQRILLPDGASIRIDNLPATDTEGYAGLSDKLDVHTWQLLKGVVLSTLLGVGTELGFGDGENDLVRALRDSTQQGASRAGDRIVARSLDVQPTIKVRPGWPLRVIVHRDLILNPWRK